MRTYIESIQSRPIVNSRGEWTVEAIVQLNNGVKGVASVPEGKSKGSKEVISFDAFRSVGVINTVINTMFRGADLIDQEEFDQLLCECDTTENKSYLGGNSMLAVSLAYSRALACVHEIPLWKYLNALYNASVRPTIPRLWVNVINGGLHAGNGLGIQEYLISPKRKGDIHSIKNIIHVYKILGEELNKMYGSNATLVGDEGGYAPLLENDERALEIITRILKREDLLSMYELGIDAAGYPKSNSDDQRTKFYRRLINTYTLTYLEDPFPEDRIESFKKLNSVSSGCVLVGDDITVTNVSHIREAVLECAIGGVIIKPNQVGTLSKTFEAIHYAQRKGLTIVLSHRSGETNDSFIVDLAVAVGAHGIKLGAPARGERVAKFNRILEIESELTASS